MQKREERKVLICASLKFLIISFSIIYSISMRKFVNESTKIVPEMLRGICLSHPSLVLLDGVNVLARRDFEDIKGEQVALISGGGSGHEPAHAGFIGEGMLTGVVCGGIYASPSAEQVLAAIRTLTGPKGCLLIVKNYTGDRLNFGIASEIAKGEGFKVEMVIVGDDVAISDEGGVITGRRGLAGTLFVHKTAGAKSSQGGNLMEVKEAALLASSSVGSFAVAISSCNIPGTTPAVNRIGANEMEMGLGIHGESGRETIPFAPLDQIIEKLINRLDKVMQLNKQPTVCVMVNNLGGSTSMEMYCAASSTVTELKKRNINCVRITSGTYMSALDMEGFMITLCICTNSSLLSLLDYNTNAPAWPQEFKISTPSSLSVAPVTHKEIETESVTKSVTAIGTKQRNAIEAALKALLNAEKYLNEIDAVVGDGDCGLTMRRGAECLLTNLDSFGTLENPPLLCKKIGKYIRDSMGGSSGAILDIMFHSAASSFLTNPNDWRTAFSVAVAQASFYGGAKVGSRTMLDALFPASESASKGGSWAEVVIAAEKGAEATKLMSALAGRSSYLNKSTTDGYADPGALAMVIVLKELQKYL